MAATVRKLDGINSYRKTLAPNCHQYYRQRPNQDHEHNPNGIDSYRNKLALSCHQCHKKCPSQDHEAVSRNASRTSCNGDRPDLRHIPYQKSIMALGGGDNSVEILAEAIHPGVKQFENKVITTKMLHEVRENGYLSFITDDRNADYWRPYVGQSVDPKRRMRQHLMAIINGAESTLHYYIIAKGAGHRAINFIKLWTLVWPDYINKHISMVFANILEMFMARCFQSLAPGILEEYFGKAEYSGTGLNRLGHGHNIDQSNKGVQKVLYPKSPQNSLEAIFKANSLVDWLDGATLDTLETRCRRHIYINPKNIAVTEDLKLFLGGAYILDDGS
ncbi:hypothetical protein BDV33DRAFT_191895 [Aspergillus novoparasiticus]|uniref:Uncharacterized protein n=1 Tax=Aspergillus novoparasiticus TaxID=986946 RepID=A0A5N6ET53_9EURO|nr:hypothetical protein BDV33DRAFT_191895 [Aspergillus novoparasiticus]